MKKACKNSPTGDHEMINPKFEKTQDRIRFDEDPYCKHCLKTEDELKSKEKIPKPSKA